MNQWLILESVPDEIRIIRLADVLATRGVTLGVLAEVLKARTLGNFAEALAAKTNEGCVINLWGDSRDKSSLEQYLGQVRELATEYSAIFLQKFPFHSLIDDPVLSSSQWEFKLYYLFV